MDQRKIGQPPLYKLRNCVAVWFSVGICRPKRSNVPFKSWEIIADNLSKAGWSWGCVSAVDSNGRTVWIVFLIIINNFLVEPNKSPNEQHSQRFGTIWSEGINARGGVSVLVRRCARNQHGSGAVATALSKGSMGSGRS